MSMAGDGSGSTAVERVLRQIDELREELFQSISDVIQIESVNPNYPGITYADVVGAEGEVARYVAALYERAGCNVDVFGLVEGRENAVGLLKGTGAGRSLIFNGHVDVVPGGDPGSWSSGPAFSGRIDEDRIWGRGACDMKGGVVSQAFAALALRSAGVELHGDLILEAVVGEERMEHELGTTAVIDRGYSADAAVVSEPSAPPDPLAVIPVTPGAWFFSVTVRGKSAHGSTRGTTIHAGGGGAEVGVNAIDKGVFVFQAMRLLEEEWALTKRHPLFPPGFFSILPGVVSGGPGEAKVPATLADHMTIEYLLWYPPDNTADQIREEVSTHVERAAQLDSWLRLHPPELEWKLSWPSSAVEVDHPLTVAAQLAHERAAEGSRFAGRPPLQGARYVEDTSFLAARGIPAISYGPGDVRVAHAADEYVLLEELVVATKTYALLAMEWCGYSDVAS
jgi:acetylornithine deacetylase/succinyl-diaminopimelate desuccinylase family protein